MLAASCVPREDHSKTQCPSYQQASTQHIFCHADFNAGDQKRKITAPGDRGYSKPQEPTALCTRYWYMRIMPEVACEKMFPFVELYFFKGTPSPPPCARYTPDPHHNVAAYNTPAFLHISIFQNSPKVKSLKLQLLTKLNVVMYHYLLVIFPEFRLFEVGSKRIYNHLSVPLLFTLFPCT